MSRMRLDHRRGGSIRGLLVTIVAVAVALVGASPAWAHGGDETTEGYLLVQQALGHLAHDTTQAGIMLAMEKVDDALATKDQEGVDVAVLTSAKAALDADQVGRARALLQQSINAAVSQLKPATGEETGTGVVLTPLEGRGGLTSLDWALLLVSALFIVLGVALSYRFRPTDNIKALRQRLQPAVPAGIHPGIREDH